MKHKFYLLLVLLINGLFIGCSSDDDGVTPPDDKDGVLVKVMSYNIYSGQKVYSGKKGMEAIAQVIKKVIRIWLAYRSLKRKPIRSRKRILLL